MESKEQSARTRLSKKFQLAEQIPAPTLRRRSDLLAITVLAFRPELLAAQPDSDALETLALLAELNRLQRDQ